MKDKVGIETMTYWQYTINYLLGYSAYSTLIFISAFRLLR